MRKIQLTEIKEIYKNIVEALVKGKIIIADAIKIARQRK